MDYPDLVGFTLECAEGIMAAQYPKFKYKIIFYSTPRKKHSPILHNEVYRVVRQSAVNETEIELIVSAFLNQPN